MLPDVRRLISCVEILTFLKQYLVVVGDNGDRDSNRVIFITIAKIKGKITDDDDLNKDDDDNYDNDQINGDNI